jgi:alkanesulfonate monooxygenase SsuD/methylene tetrahydromethanopterin reductase-like flavin-dependent oxidoreductase (luciferase family)
MVAIAQHAEEAGLDVFATGEQHNRCFVPSSPTAMPAWVAVRTQKLILSRATTPITTNDPVKIAEDYAVLQHFADGRVDVRFGRDNTVPVYPWFGKDIRQGGLTGDRELHAAPQPVARGWNRPSSAWAAKRSCARTRRMQYANSARASTGRRCTGTAPRWTSTWSKTLLAVGSPQQVIERTLQFRDYADDYQRQRFIVDHAGLPLKAVLEHIDVLGQEVVPVPRNEFAISRPATVPDAPVHPAAGEASSTHRQAGW